MFITDCSTVLDKLGDAGNWIWTRVHFQWHASSGTRTWSWKHPLLSGVFRNGSTLSSKVCRQTPICETNTLIKTSATIARPLRLEWHGPDSGRSFADKNIQITSSTAINPSVLLKISTRLITIGTICLQLRLARKYLVQCFIILFVNQK